MNLNLLGQIRGLFGSIIPFSSYYILFKGKYTGNVEVGTKILTCIVLILRTLTIYFLTESMINLMDASRVISYGVFGNVEMFGTVDVIVQSLLMILTPFIVALILAAVCNKSINTELKKERVKSRENLSHQLNIVKGLNLSVIPFLRLVFLIKNRKNINETKGLFASTIAAYLASLIYYSVLITFFTLFCYEVHTTYFEAPTRLEELRTHAYIFWIVRALLIIAPLPLVVIINEELYAQRQSKTH